MNDPYPLTPHTVLKIKRKGTEYISYIRKDRKNKSLPEILFLGGLKSDMMGTKASFLDSWCAIRNQSYTRFDYFGHGQSSGNFQEGTIGEWLANTLSIIDHVTKGPLLLIGSSLGGWLMTLAALARPERIHGLIGIASAPDFTEDLIWASLNDFQRKEFIKKGELSLPSEPGTEGIPISYSLIEEGRKHLVLTRNLEIKCPVHLIHGTADVEVPWTFSHRLAQKIQSLTLSLSLIKNGDHRLNSDFALERLASLIKEIRI